MDWNNAPDFALWVARDADGEWYGYQERPHTLHGFWRRSYGAYQRICLDLDVRWDLSLMKRPVTDLFGSEE